MTPLCALVARAARRWRDARLVVLWAPAPLFDARRFLRGVTDARLLWSAAALEGDESWELAGLGEAVRFEGAGAGRLRTVEEVATRALAEVVVEGGELEPPRPRLFGGVAFRARRGVNDGAEGPWGAFGDASFAMPRWLYARRGGRALLGLTVRGAELCDEASVTAEARKMEARVESALVARPRPAPGAMRASVAPVSAAAWEALVRHALERIGAGELEKVVAARRTRLTATRPIELDEVLERLAGSQPGCAEFALQRGAAVFVGATPELLVKKTGRVVETEALAGSAPRRDHDDGAALLASEKDRREQALVVQGLRAALEPMCDAVEAPAEPRVRSLRNVHHLSTPIAGRLRTHTHALRLVEALHPTAAVSGTPRDRAMQWIAEHEPSRGWYAAPVGWFDDAGDGAFAVALRSALIEREHAWLYSGAGLVEGSEPHLEYAETALKQAPMLAALGVHR